MLFVHGAFGGAWMWEDVFLPYFARRGRRSAAVSLRGHGQSQGYEALRTWSLADFVADTRRAIAEFSEAPVVVGHSLGGLLAQMLIGRVRMRGLVLLGSLPPEGLLFESPRLAFTDPHIWFETVTGSMARMSGPIRSAGAELLFSEGLPRKQVQAYTARLQPESPRALVEAHAPGPIVSAFPAGVPALVLGGDLDRLVMRPSTIRTALYHGAERETFGRMGHFMQLDLGADRVAARILDWMEERGLA